MNGTVNDSGKYEEESGYEKDPRGNSRQSENPTPYPDSLNAYLSSIRDIPVLTPDKERELIVRVRTGEPEAWDLFIRSNLRFVVSVARKYRHQGVPLDDLIHEGNLALIQAANHFDPDRGFRFITYAVWGIHQAMMRAIARYGGPIKLSTDKLRKRKKIREKIAELERTLGEPPSPERVAEATGEPLEEVIKLAASREALSLNAPIQDQTEITHLDLLADLDLRNPWDRLDWKAISQGVEAILCQLPAREQRVLRMRFGFNGEPMTLQQIGDRLGCSRERVRQLEQRALRTLKRLKRTARLRDYLN